MNDQARVSATAIAENAFPPASIGWRATTVLFLLYVLSMLDRSILTLLIGPIKADLGLSDFQISLLMGFAFALFYSTMALPLGFAIDRFSRRTTIFWCVVVWSLAAACCGLAASFAVLFLARVCVGGGEAGLSPGAQSFLADLFPPSKLAFPLSVFALGGKAGQAFSLLIGGLLVSLIPPAELMTIPGVGWEFKGWQIIFIVVGLPGLLLAFLIFTIPEPVRRTLPADKEIKSSYRDYLKFFAQHRALIILTHLGALFFLASALSAINWAPAHIERTFGWSPAQAGGGLGFALLLGAVLGMPLHGMIADRMFRRGVRDIHPRYLMSAALVGIPIGVTAFLVPNPIASIVLIGVFFFVISCYVGLALVIMQILVPNHLRGKSAAVLLLVTGLGGTTLGPLIVGSLTDFLFQDPAKVGRSIALSLAILLPTTALLYAFAMAPMRRAVGAPLPSAS